MKVTDEHRARAEQLAGFTRESLGGAISRPIPGIPIVRGYLAAVERIEEKTSVSGPYWRSPLGIEAFPTHPVAIDADGGEWEPAELRERAYELLVLADLAEQGVRNDG